jgi:hypothetical protein
MRGTRRASRAIHIWIILVSYGWPSIARGIVLSGGAYPAIAGAIYFAIGVVVMLFRSFAMTSPPDKSVLFGILCGSLVFAAIAGVAGIVWSGIVTVLTLPIVHVVVWTMKLRPSLPWLGAFSGGLVAFVAIIPAAVQIPKMIDKGHAWVGVVTLLIGPGLATIVGQIGGARGGKRGFERIAADRMAPKIELLRLKFAMKLQSASQLDVDASTAEATQDTARFQFRTIHLLWVGVWVSLLLTLIRLSGIPYELILPVLLAWSIFQAASLFAGKFLVRRFGPWWRGE